MEDGEGRDLFLFEEKLKRWGKAFTNLINAERA
jgi:hypothetical protein